MNRRNHSQLEVLLTPNRLGSIFKLGIPWPKNYRPDGKEWADRPDPSAWVPLCHDALVAISRLGLDDVPDMMTFLPDSSSDGFAEQAVGLLLLLDQAPRMILSGMNERWRNDYFDHLALRFAKQLHELSSGPNIESLQRWVTDGGYTFEHWSAVRVFLAAPFAHAEDMKCQYVQSSLVHELRLETESHYNAVDPHYAKDPNLRDSRDTLAFAKIAKTEGEQRDVKGQVFWYCWIMDAHPPIIRVFGRYPYRNAAVGRKSTEDEKVFLERTDHFGEVDATSARKIAEDIENGVWTPLK